MKLKRLIVKNYRGLCGDENIIDFEHSDIIFLIGKNNNGKSTFLHAYDFYVNPKEKACLTDFHNKNLENPIEIVGEFIVEEAIDAGDKALKKEDPEWIEKWVDEDGLIRIKKEWTILGGEGKKLTYSPSDKRYVEGGFGGFDTLLKKYAPTSIYINAIGTPEELEKNINDIVTKNHIKKLESQYAEQYSDLMDNLDKLKTEISKAEDIGIINDKMNSIFTSVFPDLEVEIYPVPEAGIDISKTLKSTHGIKVCNSGICDERLEFDFKSNGHGVIRQVLFSFLSTLSADLDSSRKEYLLLFEEPELFLHPNAIKSLRTQLYDLSSNSPFQVLCATHSAMMIDTSKPHSSLVRLDKSGDNSTKTYQVNFDLFTGDDKNYLQMINRFNPHICESFYSDEVILVEGDTEAIIYRELIDKYYDLDRKIDLFVLNTGSKSNMGFYQKIMTHFGIKHVVVHDVDLPTYINKNGEEKTNSMWTYNERIWEQIELSNKTHPNISRRFVHDQNFEDAHNYKENTTKGKPLSAYEYARDLEKDLDLPCFKFLEDFFGDKKLNVLQSEIIKKHSKQ